MTSNRPISNPGPSPDGSIQVQEPMSGQWVTVLAGDKVTFTNHHGGTVIHHNDRGKLKTVSLPPINGQREIIEAPMSGGRVAKIAGKFIPFNPDTRTAVQKINDAVMDSVVNKRPVDTGRLLKSITMNDLMELEREGLNYTTTGNNNTVAGFDMAKMMEAMKELGPPPKKQTIVETMDVTGKVERFVVAEEAMKFPVEFKGSFNDGDMETPASKKRGARLTEIASMEPNWLRDLAMPVFTDIGRHRDDKKDDPNIRVAIEDVHSVLGAGAFKVNSDHMNAYAEPGEEWNTRSFLYVGTTHGGQFFICQVKRFVDQDEERSTRRWVIADDFPSIVRLLDDKAQVAMGLRT